MDGTVRLTRSSLLLAAGLTTFVLLLLSSPPEGLSPNAWSVAAVAFLMAYFWITEAIPIPATALMPVFLFPLLGIGSVAQASTPFASPVIFLFLGGFILGLAMERWNLHRRIALLILQRLGTKPTSIVLGFILASAALSMFVSNTATAVMMLPIAISVMRLNDGVEAHLRKNFDLNLLLGIAYGCNIGGIGTLIGSPPNALLAGFLRDNHGIDLTFLSWMAVGMPVVVILLPVAYLLLTRLLFPMNLQELPGGLEFITAEVKKLGSMSVQERRVGWVFLFMVAGWILIPIVPEEWIALPALRWMGRFSDASVAMAGAILLFLIPASGRQPRGQGQGLMRWEDTQTLPWGVLVLFGGGLSLASAIQSTGLAGWIGGHLSVLSGWPEWVLIGAVIVLMVFLTELTSNTASTAAFLPIMAAVALGVGVPVPYLTVPIVIAASCAFMLPVATPPNAIVFGAGRISIPEMAKAGFWLNIVSILAIQLLSLILISRVFGV